jgi:hypothetical protein
MTSAGATSTTSAGAASSFFDPVGGRGHRRQAGLLLPVIRDKDRLHRRQRRARRRHHHTDVVDRQGLLRLVEPPLEHMPGIFLPRAVGSQPRDHIAHAFAALLAGKDRLVRAQRRVDIHGDLLTVGFLLRGEEIGQVVESLVDRRIGREEAPLCGHDLEDLLGQGALLGIALEGKLVAHDRCSSAWTSSRRSSR